MSYEQLISGHKWTVPTLYYAFPDSPYQIDYYLNPLTGNLQSFVSDAFTSMPNFQSLSPAQQGVVTQLLAPEITPNNSYGVGFSAVISGIDFQPGTITESQIIAFRGNFAPTPANPAVTEKGHAFKPPSQALEDPINGDFWINLAPPENTQTNIGQYGQWLIMHELGHAIGGLEDTLISLDQDKNRNTLWGVNDPQDNQKYTMMSYIPIGWKWDTSSQDIVPTKNALYYDGGSSPLYAYGLQLYDIAALQQTYAANNSMRDGDTHYAFNQGLGRNGDQTKAFLYTIWDGGTDDHDTLDASGFTNFGAKIDLRPGEFSSIGENGKGGAVYDPSANVDVGNVAIAYGVTIENAIGTQKADTIIGNSADNILIGLRGDDQFLVGEGNNVIQGGYSPAHLSNINRTIPSGHVANLPPNGIAISEDGTDTVAYALFNGGVHVVYDKPTREGVVYKYLGQDSAKGDPSVHRDYTDHFSSIEAFLGGANLSGGQAYKSTLQFTGSSTIQEIQPSEPLKSKHAFLLDNEVSIETTAFSGFVGDGGDQVFALLDPSGLELDGGGGEDTLRLLNHTSFHSGKGVQVGASSIVSAAATTEEDGSSDATAVNIENFEVAAGKSGYFVVHEMGNNFEQSIFFGGGVSLPKILVAPVEYTTLSYKNYDQKLTFGTFEAGSNESIGVITDELGNRDTFNALDNYVSIVGSDNGDTYHLQEALNGNLPLFTGAGDDQYLLLSSGHSTGGTSTQPIVYGGGNDVRHVEKPEGVTVLPTNPRNMQYIMPLGVQLSDLSYSISETTTGIEPAPISTLATVIDSLITIQGMGSIKTEVATVDYQVTYSTDETKIMYSPDIYLQNETGWTRVTFVSETEQDQPFSSFNGNFVPVVFEVSDPMNSPRVIMPQPEDPAPEQPFTSSRPDYYHGTFGDDVFDLSVFSGIPNFRGYDGNDTIIGSDADNIIEGGAGDDIIAGRGGNDLLKGGAGNDTYLFAAGDGTDTIVDYDGFNKLKLEGNIDLASIQYIGVGDDLHLNIASGVIIQGYYSNVNTISVIETDDLTQFDFSGEAANAIRLPEGTIPGTNGDDVLSGDSGDNILAGLAGNDVYEFSAGNGTDTIIDTEGINTIRFLDLIDPTTLTYNIDGDNLIIQGADQIIVANYFTEANTITNIEIAATGQVFNLADLVEQYANFPGDDFIVNDFEVVTGTIGNDTFTFTGVISTAFGDGGNDIFYSNFGSHVINGDNGFDTLNYRLLAGDIDYYIEAPSGNVIGYALGDRTGGGAPAGFEQFSGIEKYVTGNGSDAIVGSTNSEVFDTGAGDDSVYSGGGGDIFIGGAGNDYYEGSAGDFDTVSYENTTMGINVDLDFGQADGEEIDQDFFQGINRAIGGTGNDTLSGGLSADQTLEGGESHDFYRVSILFGHETTIVDGGTDEFGFAENSVELYDWDGTQFSDIFVEDLHVTQDGNDLILTHTGSGGSIRFVNGINEAVVSEISFNTGFVFYSELLDALNTGGIIGGEAPNEAPIAQDDSFTGTEDAAVTGNVLADNGNGADSDADGDTLTVTPATLTTAQGGSVVLLENGDFTYTPAADFNGSDSFSYTVTDGNGNGGSSAATVTIEIAPVNDTPVAAEDVFILDEDTVLSGNLLVENGNGADIDVDGDNLSVVAETLVTAQGGTVDILANGDFTYTPAENFNGADSFSYTLDDGNGGTAFGNVSLTVNPVNDAPLAADDTAVTDEDTAVIVNVLANDSDVENDILSISAVTDGANGTVSHDGTSVTYTPDADFNGSDSFTYTVSDGNGGFDTATVNVTVNPVNDNPVAADDSFTGDEDTVIAGNVLADNGNGADSDVDGDTLSVVAETIITSQGGAVDILTNGDFTYTPAENFNGADSFSYTLDDGNGGSAVGYVSLTVNPVNDAPVANDDTATTDEDTAVVIDVLANDTDVENDALSVFAANDGANGTVSFDGTSVTYTPNTGFSGADSFTYTVSDGNGGFDTATVNVTVNAAQTNTPPVANDDDFTVEHGNALTGNVLADNGHGADSDADNDNLTVTAAAIMTLAGATVTILANGDFTYEGATGFVGTDSFEYTLEDANGGFDTAFANITVTAPAGAVVGTEGDDNIASGSGNDVIFLPGGNNDVSSGSGNDAIYAGNGDDQVASGSGNDNVTITGGNNSVQGGSGNDAVTTGDGDDVIDGGSGNDTIISSGGDNVITGGSGDDFLQTGWGNDLLIGGSGNDWLDGGAGINTLTGGSGSDTFVLGTLNAQNTITDFDTWDGDKLHLADLLTGFDPLAHALSDFVQATQNGNNTHISVDPDGTGTEFAMTEIAVLEGTALDLDDLTGHLLIA